VRSYVGLGYVLGFWINILFIIIPVLYLAFGIYNVCWYLLFGAYCLLPLLVTLLVVILHSCLTLLIWLLYV